MITPEPGDEYATAFRAPAPPFVAVIFAALSPGRGSSTVSSSGIQDVDSPLAASAPLSSRQLRWRLALSALTLDQRLTEIQAAGIDAALVLRFEFMGKGFTKFIAFLTSSAIGLAVLAFLDQVFGSGTMFS